MASTSTTVSIPLVNLPTHAGVSNTTNSVQPGSVPNLPLSGQPQNSPQPVELPTITAPVNTQSSNTNSQPQPQPQPQPQSQPSAHQAVVSASRSRFQTALSVAGIFFAVVATDWAIGTTVPLLKLARWTARNDYLQSCISSLGVAEVQTADCNKTIESGPKPPPYQKRDVLQNDVSWKSFNICPILEIGLRLAIQLFWWSYFPPQVTLWTTQYVLYRLNIKHRCQLKRIHLYSLVTDLCALFYYIPFGWVFITFAVKDDHVLWAPDVILAFFCLSWHILLTLEYADAASKSKARSYRLYGTLCERFPVENDLEARKPMLNCYKCRSEKSSILTSNEILLATTLEVETTSVIRNRD